MASGAVDARPLVVFLNLRAGAHGKIEIDALVKERFAAHGIDVDVVPLHGRDQAGEAGAVRAAALGASTVVAGGGDGTVGFVASALAGSPTRLGVLPLGTLNHLAKDLGIPVDLDQAIATIAAGRVTAIDVGEVNNRVFVNNCSIGFYPSLVHARDELQRRGHGKWPAFAIAVTRILRRQRRLLVRLEADGQPSVWRTPFVMVGNNEYDIAGLRVAGRSSLSRGQLFTYVAPHVRTRDLPTALLYELFGRVLQGRSRRSDTFQVLSAAELWVDAPGFRTLEVALDGEVLTATLPLHFRSRPSALNVLVPPG